MEQNFVRGSSSIVRLEVHVSYKVKYCHKVFDFVDVKNRCEVIFREVAAEMRIEIKEIGFDRDHVPMVSVKADFFYFNSHLCCDFTKNYFTTILDVNKVKYLMTVFYLVTYMNFQPHNARATSNEI